MLLKILHVCHARNSATESIDQELQFVGSESGKLIAVRDIIRKVSNRLIGKVTVEISFF